MADIKKIFGRNVRTHREKLKISQEKLAELCELHRTYIGAIEHAVKEMYLLKTSKRLQEL